MTSRDWLTQHGDVKPGQVDVTALFTNEFNPFAGSASASPSSSTSAKG